jgi:23S rRNA (adenine2030-N6)-methyltransferase
MCTLLRLPLYTRSVDSYYHGFMLSYRHAFHAGNHADVFKHLALAECLRLLSRKDKGFLVVDTHAGAGAYALTEGYAAQNEEWAAGVGRLRSARGGADQALPGAVVAYLDLVDAYSASEGRGDGALYPGSPALIAGALRPQDRAVFCELHPADRELLAARFAADGRVRVRSEDGFAALKALLPPPTRRGLVFIDPSYELAEDYARVPAALSDGLRRFETGTFVVWYPLLERPEALALGSALRAAAAGRPALDAALRVRSSAPGERGMAGSGLFVVNPPWTLSDTLRDCLPFLARVLAADGGADWTLEAHS